MSKLHVIQVANGANPYNNTIGGIVPYISDIVGISTRDDRIDNSEMKHSIIGSGLPLFDGYYCLSKRNYPNVVFFLQLFWCLSKFPNSPNVVYHIHTTYLGLPFYLFKRKAKLVLTVHGVTDVTRKKRKTRLEYLFYRMLNFVTMRGYHGIIAVTQESLIHFDKRYKVNEKCRKCVIPTGVNTKVFYPKSKSERRAKYGIPIETKVILFVGRFVWEKNIDLILDAYSLFASHFNGDCRLILIGDGYLYKTMKEKALSLNIPSTYFLGSLSRMEVSEYMSISDAYVMTSLIEGSPIALKEALACNLPVVAVPVGDVEQLLPNFPGSAICDYDALDIGNKLIEIVTRKDNIDYTKAIRPYSMTVFRSRIHEFYREIIHA